MAASNHRRQKVRAIKVSTRKRTKQTRNMKILSPKKSSSSSISAPLGIFILISFVLLVNTLIDLVGEHQSDHNNDNQPQQPPRLFRPMRAQAGSKSKSKSSKTTVIAISGGGHSAKPHPVPVPWPVIHCHHHHHHLKYVPKPILVHHWVKKQKAASLPIEFHESSNEHYQVMDSRGAVVSANAGQSIAQPQQHIPTMALPFNNDLSQNQQHQVSFLADNSLAPLDQQQQQQLNSAYPNLGLGAMPPNNNNHQSLPKVPFSDLMDGSQLVSALSNEFDTGGATGGAPMSASASSNLFDGALEMAPPLDLSKFQQQQQNAHFGAQPKFPSKAAMPHFSDKQLEKLTKSILSAQQKGAHSLQGNNKRHTSGQNKPPRDTDSGLDSLKSTNVVALATSSATSGHHQQVPDINGTFYGLDGYDFGPSSSGDGQSAASPTAAAAANETRHGGTKPSHPFDDVHDQLKDESMSHQNIVTAANQRSSPKATTTMMMMGKQQQQQDLNLAQANLKEESDSRQAYQRLAFESARQLVALNEADRQRALAGLMMVGPQQQQQQNMMMSRPQLGQQSQQVVAMPPPPPTQIGTNQLFNPQAAAASQRTMSESHAISLMTHLAERMAQLEASNLVERHRTLAGANKSTHSTSGPKKIGAIGSSGANHLLGGFWSNLCLFARATPVRLRTANHKDTKRRISSGAQVHVLQPTTSTTTTTTTKSAPPTNYQRFLTWQSTSSTTTTQSPRVAQQSSKFLTTSDNDYVITASPLYLNLMAPSGGNYRQQQISGVSHNQAASLQPHMSAYGQRNTVPAGIHSQPQEKLLTEGSSQVNKIAQLPSFVRPPPGFNANVAKPAGAQQPKRNLGAAPPTPASRPPSIGDSQQQQQQPQQQQVISTKPPLTGTVSTTPPSATPTTTTQMSPDQENNFYLGQREHLASELVEASSTSSSLMPPSPSAATDQTTLVAQPPHGASYPTPPIATSVSSSPTAYSPQPSNVMGQSVVAAPSGMQQQQQQQFAPTPEQLQPFLQFPMSPAQWSSEALRSLNAGDHQQQQASSEQVTSAASEEDAQSNEQQSQLDGGAQVDSSQADSGQEASGGGEQQDKLLSLDPNDGQAHTYYLDSNGNLETATSDQVQQPQQHQQQQQQAPQQHDMSQQFEQMVLLNDPQQAMMMAAAATGGGGPSMATPTWPFGSHAHQFQTPFSTTPNWPTQAASEQAAQSIVNMQQTVHQPYGYYTTGSPVDASWPPLSASSVSPYDARMHQHFLAQSFPAMAQAPPSMQFASSSARKQKMVAPPGGGNMDQFVASSLASPMSEMNQLRQLQGRLAGGVMGNQMGGNYSGLAGSLGGRLLPNQMQSRFPLAGQAGAGGLPQMPQIPNIPQPPQIPNLPMPPPGMMQMAASVALPLAMARVTRQNNRFRNNQVNSAATQGGSTTTAGQRFLRGASNLTNRLMRTRRRPTSTSSPQLAMGGGQSSTPFNRQRRRRPSLLSLSAPNRVSSMFGQPSSVTPLTSAAYRPHRHHGQPMSMRFIQTVVDMSRRPPVIAAASNLAVSATSGVLSAATKATAAAATAGASAAAAAAASPTGSQSGASNAARVAAATKVISSAVANAAASGPVDKLKPKIDHIDELQEISGRQPVVLRNSTRPTTRSGAHTSLGAGSSSSSSSVVFAGLPPIALTDGTLHFFESMTSPVDLLNRQLRRARELEWHRQQQQQQQTPPEKIAATTIAHTHTHQQQAQLRQLHHQPQFELLRLRPHSSHATALNIPSQTQLSYYQMVTAATPAPQQAEQFVDPTTTTTTTGSTSLDDSTSGQASEQHDDDAHQQPDLMSAELTGPVNTSTFHAPQHAPQVVTNHFNLLMFTNKNVTGNLLAPSGLTPQAPNGSEAEQSVQLMEPTAVAVEAANGNGPNQHQPQSGEPEQQVAANQLESNQQDDEQRRQYEAMLADNNQEQLQQQAHDASRIEQPQQQQPIGNDARAQSVREFTASNAMTGLASAAPNKQESAAPNGMILIAMTPSESSGGESKEDSRTLETANSASTSSRLPDSNASQSVTPAVLVEEKTTKAPKRKSKKKTTSPLGEKKHRLVTTKSPSATTSTTTSSTSAAPSTIVNMASRDEYATAGSQWTEIKAPTATSPKPVEDSTGIKGKKMSHLKTVLTKRSTSARPTGVSPLNTNKSVDSEFGGSENIETTSAGGHKSTGETSERRTTLAPVAQAQVQMADDQSADYVRAIKLVRGVNYPWPPPTQSSKMLATTLY